jgi:hypothetical protein
VDYIQVRKDLRWKTAWEVSSMDEAKEFLTQSSKDHCSSLPWSRDGQEKGTLYRVSMFKQ